MENKGFIRDSVMAHADAYRELVCRIWDYAETAFLEKQSADALCGALEQAGFAVERGVAGMQTAFTGRWGSGKPVIGFLGEFDALSGINQMSGSDVKQPTSPEMLGKPGHGCGHNCLGVGSLAGAIAAKEYLEKTGQSGTVVYFGCPAEEGGSGKAFMARTGLFRDVDAALTWHTGDVNMIYSSSSLANCQVLFRFRGVAAHAAADPERGRSALDAVELMNTGVQYLREHMIDAARIHYAIIDTGGYSPNVVQPKASVLYLIRAPKTSQVQELYRRVRLIADGAAMMTETTVEADFMKACSNVLVNETIERALYSNMELFPLPEYTPEEYAFARRMIAAYESPSTALTSTLEKCPEELQDQVRALFRDGKGINDFLVPYFHDGHVAAGSTDVGDVSLNCPTSQFLAAALPDGCPGHSWQQVACTKTPAAQKAVLYAGMVLGGTAIDLIEQPELLQKAKDEFRYRMGGEIYRCPIPDGVEPRALSLKL